MGDEKMNTPMDIVKSYPVRKSKKQKASFRADVIAWLEALGYSVTVEQGSFRSSNVVIGDPKSAKYLVTAHYDICALKRGWAGLYLSRIHTPKDTILDETNVNLLRAALTTLITGSAVQ